MSPSFITIDTSPDFDFDPSPAPAPFKQNGIVSNPTQTLLLAPPSVAAHEEKLRGLFTAFDRSTTDLQMLVDIATGWGCSFNI